MKDTRAGITALALHVAGSFIINLVSSIKSTPARTRLRKGTQDVFTLRRLYPVLNELSKGRSEKMSFQLPGSIKWLFLPLLRIAAIRKSQDVILGIFQQNHVLNSLTRVINTCLRLHKPLLRKSLS
jgi:hypothetical protein